jgi:hypothetical protein
MAAKGGVGRFFSPPREQEPAKIYAYNKKLEKLWRHPRILVQKKGERLLFWLRKS